MTPCILRVAVPAPLDRIFDYLCPGGSTPRPGVRVRVPFGRSSLIGVVLEVARQSAMGVDKLRAVEAILDDEPLLAASDLAFLCWAASYYHYPVGEVVATALPLRLRKQAGALSLGEPGWMLTAAGHRLEPGVLRRAPRQAEMLAALCAADGMATLHRLRMHADDAPATLRRMQAKGWVEPCELPPLAHVPHSAPGLELNAEQAIAVTAVVAALGDFGAFVLDGVTGSGKTEVYLQIAAQVLARGQSVMILVPEISLTPQLQQRFQRRLGAGVLVLHSGLAEGEREQAWQRVRLGLSQVVVGTRSLVFQPLPDLGLVIVDEEHDTSLKQQEGFRYSARDLAVVRARRAACPVLLGSATPSLETLRNAINGRYTHLHLTCRAGAARVPRLELLDIRTQPLHKGMAGALLTATEAALARGEQVLLFLNRRGYSPVLSCFSCGWLSDCPRCDARQTMHRTANLLWCHHCGSQRRVPVVCPACGAADLHPLGQGTEQLEEVLGERFADYPLIRVDRDATARKGSLHALLEQVHTVDAAILVGTQMLAKGHHFPRVTLVGILDADGGLFSADFRAAERTAQLIVQVAGRAGRGERPGRVLIQTRYPEHPLLQTLVQAGYPAFARAALSEREAAELPPYTSQAMLRAEANDAETPLAFLHRVAEHMRPDLPAGVDLWGPVPAPMARRAGRQRAHLLIQAPRRDDLHAVLTPLPGLIASLRETRKVRWSLDVDPVDLY